MFDLQVFAKVITLLFEKKLAGTFMASTRAPGEYVSTATCGYAVSETFYLKFEVRKMINIVT